MPLPDIPAVEVALIEKTNALRAEHDLEKLTPNRTLSEAARSYASFLALTNQFSHTADAKGPGDRLRLKGYEWCKMGENLALRGNPQGFTTQTLTADVMNGWMKSAEHKTNLLEPTVTEIGVGVAQTKEASPKFISVQLFARPLSLRFPIELKNTTSVAVPYTLNGKSKVIPSHRSIRHWTCEPKSFSFPQIEKTQISSRYIARDKTLFILSEDSDRNLKVQISSQQ